MLWGEGVELEIKKIAKAWGSLEGGVTQRKWRV